MHVEPSVLIDPFEKTGLSTSHLCTDLPLKAKEFAHACLLLYFIIFMSYISSPSKQILIFDTRMRFMPTSYFVRSEIRAIRGTLVY